MIKGYQVHLFHRQGSCNYCQVNGVNLASASESKILAFFQELRQRGVDCLWVSSESVLHPDFTSVVRCARRTSLSLDLIVCSHCSATHFEKISRPCFQEFRQRIEWLVPEKEALNRLSQLNPERVGPKVIALQENSFRQTLRLWHQERKQNLWPVYLSAPFYSQNQEFGVTESKLIKFFDACSSGRHHHLCRLTPVFQTEIFSLAQWEFLTEMHSEGVCQGKEVDISVVIPAFCDVNSLASLLEGLSQQTLDAGKFEVIVVDDESPPGLHNVFLEYLNARTGRNGFYLRFPFGSKSRWGNRDFRAARSRYLGAQLARGNVLAFLDSDLLISKDYLQRVFFEVRGGRVIQARRQESRVDSYWKRFYDDANHWMALNDPWKYICSHSLSLSRACYENCGGFTSEFRDYGYEDVDLGYRLFMAGAKFELLNESVTHLSVPIALRRYQLSRSVRFGKLQRSGAYFLRNNFSAEVISHLRYLYLKPHIALESLRSTFVNLHQTNPVRRFLSVCRF